MHPDFNIDHIPPATPVRSHAAAMEWLQSMVDKAAAESKERIFPIAGPDYHIPYHIEFKTKSPMVLGLPAAVPPGTLITATMKGRRMVFDGVSHVNATEQQPGIHTIQLTMNKEFRTWYVSTHPKYWRRKPRKPSPFKKPTA